MKGLILAEIDLLELSIAANLEAVFGPGSVTSELPELVNQAAAWSIFNLSPMLTPQTFRNIQGAVSYLYPPDLALPFGSTETPPPAREPLSWKQVDSLLRFWSLLSSDDGHASFIFIAEGNSSFLDACLSAEDSETKHNGSGRLNFVLCFVLLLRQTWEDVTRSQGGEPVIQLGKREIVQMSRQWEKTDPFAPCYSLAFNNINLSIDPFQETEIILSSVRKLVEDWHEKLSREHAENWSIEERRLHGDNYIEGLDPVKGFTYKGRGDKGRRLETFTSEAVEALLVYTLRQSMTPVEINKRFFPEWPNDSDAGTRPKAKRNTDRFKLAERLISNAFSGVSMQA